MIEKLERTIAGLIAVGPELEDGQLTPWAVTLEHATKALHNLWLAEVARNEARPMHHRQG